MVAAANIGRRCRVAVIACAVAAVAAAVARRVTSNSHILDEITLERRASVRHRGACTVEQCPADRGDGMGEFLSQLEQRTQQVKITLANLEAQKARIEQQIAQLQPVIPHYDALLTAERALKEANIEMEEGEAAASETPAAPAPYVPSWEAQQRTWS
jgi:hypothetical protein